MLGAHRTKTESTLQFKLLDHNQYEINIYKLQNLKHLYKTYLCTKFTNINKTVERKHETFPRNLYAILNKTQGTISKYTTISIHDSRAIGNTINIFMLSKLQYTYK